MVVLSYDFLLLYLGKKIIIVFIDLHLVVVIFRNCYQLVRDILTWDVRQVKKFKLTIRLLFKCYAGDVVLAMKT